MKTIMLLIIYLLIQSISKAQMVDSVSMKCERVWNLGELINNDKEQNSYYIVKISFINNSFKEKKFVTHDTWMNSFIFNDSISLNPFVFISNNEIPPRKVISKYFLLILPLNYRMPKKIPINFIWISAEEFSSAKYNNQVEEEMRKTIKDIPTKNTKDLSIEVRSNQQQKLFLKYDASGGIRKEFFIQKNKNDTKNILHCELEL